MSDLKRQYINTLVAEIAKCAKTVSSDWVILRLNPTPAMIRAGISPDLSAAFFDSSIAGAVEKCVAWLNQRSFKQLHGIGSGDLVRFRATTNFKAADRGPFVIGMSSYNQHGEPVVWLNGLAGCVPIKQLRLVDQVRQQVAA